MYRRTRKRAAERDIAFVFQLFALYPHMNVRKNIGFSLKCQGMAAAEINRRVEEAGRILRIEKTENDERYLKYADLFVSRFMDLRVDIPLEQALDLGWKTMAECFEREEVGIKKADLDKHWPTPEVSGR